MNQKELVLSAFHGEKTPRVPAAFWFHHSVTDTAEELINQQLSLYREADMDFIKIMYDLEYCLDEKITKPSDWYHIKPKGKQSPFYQKQVDIIKGILDGANGECVVLNTMFGPMRHAVWVANNDNDMMMQHAKEDRKALQSGVMAIAECMAEWAEGFMQTGIDGIFYAAQYGETGRFNEEEWEELIYKSDLVVLNAVKSAKDKTLILHPCGQPMYQHKVELHRYKDYPKDMVNWATHANCFSLQQGKELFGCPIMGGMDNRGALLGEDIAAVEQEITEVLRRCPTEGFILGADCSLPGKPSITTLKAAMKFIKNYSLK